MCRVFGVLLYGSKYCTGTTYVGSFIHPNNVYVSMTQCILYDDDYFITCTYTGLNSYINRKARRTADTLLLLIRLNVKKIK